MRLRWWKLLSIVLVFYTLYFGLMGEVPSKDILNETIRNLYYHVPMWFCMILLFAYAFVYAIRYLSSNNIQYDLKSAAFNKVGIVFSLSLIHI
jgi:heme exporter protein C